MSQVLVVIPMFNHHAITKRCIDLTLKNAGMQVDILVVDDGSHKHFLATEYDFNVHVLRLDENSGYTNATNQGILWGKHKYKYVHLLNNDTLPKAGFIKILYDYMEANDVVGIAGSVRLNKLDGKKFTEIHGIDLIRGYQLVYEGWIEPNDSRWKSEALICDWFPVCSALVRTKMMKYIGILDPQFRNHCSDSDYCIRANHNKWNVVVLPKSQVVHEHQTTVRDHNEHVGIDQKLFIEKIAGIKYQQLMSRLPLDKEQNYWGTLTFGRREIDNANQPTPA